MTEPPARPERPPSKAAKPDREARLAQALRANLRRRKAAVGRPSPDDPKGE